MDKELNKAKNLFSFAFAICIGGIIVRFNPEYLIALLRAINMEDLIPKDAQKANKAIEIYAAIQTLLGSSLLVVSGLWFHSISKNKQEE